MHGFSIPLSKSFGGFPLPCALETLSTVIKNLRASSHSAEVGAGPQWQKCVLQRLQISLYVVVV